MDADAELRLVRAEIVFMLESRNVGGGFGWPPGEEQRYEELCRREKVLLAVTHERVGAQPIGRK